MSHGCAWYYFTGTFDITKPFETAYFFDTTKNAIVAKNARVPKYEFGIGRSCDECLQRASAL